MVIPTALAIGIGAPVVTGLLSGMFKKGGAKQYMKFFGTAAIATFATAAVVSYLMPPAPAPPAAAVAVARPPQQVSKSVSDVTVQLGRYAGGINYPGQITGIDPEGVFTDGSIIFVD